MAPGPDHRHRGRRTYDYAALGQRREHRHRGFDSLGAAIPVRAFAQCSLGRLHAPALRALPYDRGKLGAARRVGEKPGTPNEDTVGVIAASYRALAKPA